MFHILPSLFPIAQGKHCPEADVCSGHCDPIPHVIPHPDCPSVKDLLFQLLGVLWKRLSADCPPWGERGLGR